MGLEYIDCVLLHQPIGNVYGAWRALEEAYQAGKIRVFGVANFNRAKFAEFIGLVEIEPMINQIELHPFFQQAQAVEEMKKAGCLPQAWRPLAEGKNGIFTHPVLTHIGEKYGKSAAQIALKWNAQRGVSIIPKSVHFKRIEQNIDIWDFSLTDEDLREVASLDLGYSEIIDHNDPEVVKFLLTLKTPD